MLTGPQIRRARELLTWSCADLSRRAFLPIAAVEAIEEHPSAFGSLDGQVLALRRTCERAGVDFTADGPKLRVKT